MGWLRRGRGLGGVWPVAAIVAAIVAAAPGPARGEAAASREDAKALANKILARAYDAFDGKRFGEAAGAYLEFFHVVEVHQLPLKPKLLANAALAFERIGECERVAELLERYVALEQRPGRDVLRRLEEARACAPALAIEVEPAGARVEVDGRARGATPLRVHLRPGTHAVRVTAEGRVALEETIAVEPRTPQSIRRTLERAPPPAPTALAAPPAAPIADATPPLPKADPQARPQAPAIPTAASGALVVVPALEEPASSPTWGWALGGGGIAALAGAVALEVLAHAAEQRRDDERAKGESVRSGAVIRDEDARRARFELGAGVSLGLSAVLLGVAGYLLFLE